MAWHVAGKGNKNNIIKKKFRKLWNVIRKPSELQMRQINSPICIVSRDESNSILRSGKFSKLQNGPFRCTTTEPNPDQNSGKLLRWRPCHLIHDNYSLMTAQINSKFLGPYNHYEHLKKLMKFDSRIAQFGVHMKKIWDFEVWWKVCN